LKGSVGDGDLAAAIQAGVVLRRVIELVAEGEIYASTPSGVAYLRRLEGALTALESLAYKNGIH
jgi:hypothetical protein